MGRQWMILAFTVGKMLVAIGAVAHILACVWFALGDTVSSFDTGPPSWLQLARIQDASFQIQYIHSLTWILLPPAPAPLDPLSGIEQMAAGASACRRVVELESERAQSCSAGRLTWGHWHYLGSGISVSVVSSTGYACNQDGTADTGPGGRLKVNTAECEACTQRFLQCPRLLCEG